MWGGDEWLINNNLKWVSNAPHIRVRGSALNKYVFYHRSHKQMIIIDGTLNSLRLPMFCFYSIPKIMYLVYHVFSNRPVSLLIKHRGSFKKWFHITWILERKSDRDEMVKEQKYCKSLTWLLRFNFKKSNTCVATIEFNMKLFEHNSEFNVVLLLYKNE